jgi:2-hydroxycyclohexanecarboxyl-CoA dehydrogenase
VTADGSPTGRRGGPAVGPRGLALVSGGSGGIGAAICRQLHADGWGVVVGYVSEQRAKELAASLATETVPASTLPLDMADPAQIRSSIERLVAENVRVDALVLNGGVSETRPFVETDEKAWWAELDVNLMGPMLAVKLCLPGMVEAGQGTIVGITSDAANVGDHSHAPYAAAKAALMAFLRTIVREYGKKGVVANGVAPGPIDTAMLRGAFGDAENTERSLEALRRLVPMRRLGEPDEVAAAVRYLVSDNAYAAGQHLSVGGGVTMQ